MKKSLSSLFIITILIFQNSCEELISNNIDNQEMKKVRSENTALKIQIDKLQRQINKDKEQVVLKDLIISLYDLRHAVEKYALDNKGSYPEAKNFNELSKIIEGNLPKDFMIDQTYIETIKSTTKGYIFIANFDDRKVVVSNLI
ncbi:MAG: hypothetical protein U0354_17115 [Candidatus Sericytochromatia bacterium]